MKSVEEIEGALRGLLLESDAMTLQLIFWKLIREATQATLRELEPEQLTEAIEEFEAIHRGMWESIMEVDKIESDRYRERAEMATPEQKCSELFRDVFVRANAEEGE